MLLDQIGKVSWFVAGKHFVCSDISRTGRAWEKFCTGSLHRLHFSLVCGSELSSGFDSKRSCASALQVKIIVMLFAQTWATTEQMFKMWRAFGSAQMHKKAIELRI